MKSDVIHILESKFPLKRFKLKKCVTETETSGCLCLVLPQNRTNCPTD